MKQDRLQLQRFELKYIVREEIALAVRDFVSSYLDLDEFGATQSNLSYPVHSLYLDSDDLTLYWQTINGNKNRYKLRVRFYESRPEAPVFFEIKRRTNNAISKQRCPVIRDAAVRVLAGQLPSPAEIVSDDLKHHSAIQNVVRLITDHGYRPVAHVAYLREAWLSRADNSIRVTMDRNVRTEPELVARLQPEMTHPAYVFGDRVVLELKFTGTFPDWFGELVRIFNLTQSSAAKYADGVALVGERNFETYPARPRAGEAAENLASRRTALARSCGAGVFAAGSLA